MLFRLLFNHLLPFQNILSIQVKLHFVVSVEPPHNLAQHTFVPRPYSPSFTGYVMQQAKASIYCYLDNQELLFRDCYWLFSLLQSCRTLRQFQCGPSNGTLLD